jgi:hypothetical protein
MTATRASTRVSVLAACLVLWSTLLVQSALAQDEHAKGGATASSIHFELPAQPLADALAAFGHMTDLSVLSGSNLIAGRTSAPLSGDYAPREALLRLLAGTGLQVKFTGSDWAVIVPSAPASLPQPPVAASTDSGDPPIAGAVVRGNDYRSYAAMVQGRLADVLCRTPQTRPGSYRLAVQLRIDDTGTVIASQLLDSTGLSSRDAAIEREIRGMVLDSAPPAALKQPVTILLRPLSDGMVSICPPTGEQG